MLGIVCVCLRLTLNLALLDYVRPCFAHTVFKHIITVLQEEQDVARSVQENGHFTLHHWSKRYIIYT